MAWGLRPLRQHAQDPVLPERQARFAWYESFANRLDEIFVAVFARQPRSLLEAHANQPKFGQSYGVFIAAFRELKKLPKSDLCFVEPSFVEVHITPGDPPVNQEV